jgi:hypothetical protein
VLGPRALGLTNLVVAVPFATLDVDADADGNPIELRVTATWSATRSGKQTPVSVAMTYAFDRGTGPTVFGPDEVWTMSTSKLFKYRLGAPETWAVRPATSLKYVDTVEGDDYLYIGASRERTYGDSLSRIATYFKTHRLLVDFKSWKFVSMKSVTIAGAPGRVITAHAVSGSDKLTVMLYLAIRGSWVYEVAIIDLQGNEAAQASFGSKVISTFRFPG